jgi:hypothetical protein
VIAAQGRFSRCRLRPWLAALASWRPRARALSAATGGAAIRTCAQIDESFRKCKKTLFTPSTGTSGPEAGASLPCSRLRRGWRERGPAFSPRAALAGGCYSSLLWCRQKPDLRRTQRQAGADTFGASPPAARTYRYVTSFGSNFGGILRVLSDAFLGLPNRCCAMQRHAGAHRF